MDRVIEVEGGFDCIVAGRQFGTWATKALAKAGMQVEQQRAAKRAASMERYVLSDSDWAYIAKSLSA